MTFMESIFMLGIPLWGKKFKIRYGRASSPRRRFILPVSRRM